MKVFVDTCAFYALADKDDKNHDPASEIIERLVHERAELYTSNFVLSETYTLVRNNLGHSKIADLIEKIKQSVKLIRITEEMEEKATQIFLRYSDKNFSFTDCTSFAIIKELKIEKAFTFDKHFHQYGIAIVS